MSGMDPEIKARWLAALRSNRYQQGVRRLHYVDDRGMHRYCCLGVLCELAVDDGVIERLRTEQLAWFTYGTDVDEHHGHDVDDRISTSVLPNRVVEWAGLDGYSPVVGSDNQRAELVTLNDDQTPFAEIANLIEEHL